MDKEREISIRFFSEMLRIRMVENAIADNYNNVIREMHTPIHLCEGQEAVAVGVCSQLEKEDVIFSTHRCHGHYLAKGGNLDGMIAELFTKETGCCHGMGGSMHLTDRCSGVAVSSAIVAGNVSIATGYALAFKMSGYNNVAVAFLGDGATEEGTVYESICFAQIHKLPILYVCENNLYAISTGLGPREPLSSIEKKFSTICKTKEIDGNDVFAVADVAKRAINRIKGGAGPYFIECKTYRLRDHHNVTTGIESGYRTQEEWDLWALNSPIKRVEDYIDKRGWLTSYEKECIIKKIQLEISEAFKSAHADSLPDTSKYQEYLWG